MIRIELQAALNKVIKKMKLPAEARDQAPNAASDFVLDHPQDKKFGDFTTNIAMRLAKVLKKSPMEIGQQIVTLIEKDKSVKKLIQKTEVAPPGFINFYLSPEVLTEELVGINKLKDKYGQLKLGAGKKMVVEHTSVNPNKAMHVGHLRNMAIGDSVAALMAKVGYKVEVENYIDDTGVQVADVVVALRHLKRQPKAGQKFDHYCWDIYAAIQKVYETNPELAEERTKVQHALESEDNELSRQAEELVTKIIHDHLQTAGRLGVFYDAFIFESSILRSGMWQKTFEQLKKSGKVVLEKEGPNAGCWVFKNLALSPDEKLKNPDKILVTSKGVAVYTAKDIAYHLWKFGKGTGDFKYVKIAKQGNGSPLWASANSKRQKGPSQKFGHGQAVITVVDVRQTYPQLVVKSALKELGLTAQAENLKHLGYEVVSLSAETAQALGVSVEEGKGSYAMSGRKGIGVKADDLIDAL
ncbi:arginine--tRNA ligase, partial [Candidatus Uhrbacteria bacterium]|nr:arginine--tRNA ligase [Candidatus Uhrbacteria bacterium]